MMEIQNAPKLEPNLVSDSQFEIGKPQDNALHKLISDYKWTDAQRLLTNYPSLASKRGAFGELPLHMSLKRGGPEEFIMQLIELFDEAVKLSGLNDHSLPLHHATIHCHSAKVIIALIRVYPEALDQKDEDGDTPRNCVRKNLDTFAKEAIMKPTFYWIELVQKFRKEAEERVGKELGAQITDLEEKLEKEKKSAEEKILELQNLLKEKERELEQKTAS